VELHKTFAEINLKALSHNLNVVRKKTGNKEILAVVKANAYGHGSVEISQRLIQHHVSMLGVAYTGEGIVIREAGIKIPIVVFFDRDNSDACLKHNLTPVISDLNSGKKLSTLAYRQNRKIPIHIKVDTGMGRVGLTMDNAIKVIREISSLRNIRLEGLMSHFSDADLLDKDFANLQLKHFKKLVKSLTQDKITFKYLHMSNSAAVLTMPDAHFNLVRPGIMLYGYACCERDKIKPVMSLKSRIILLKKVPAGTPVSYARTFITKKKSTIATIPIGYADGYSRKLSNSGEVLINGYRAPVIGRVCMDAIMVDVTHIRNVSYKSEVVLIGQSEKELITAEDVAEKTDTIPYEVLTSVGSRVQRIYK